MALLRRVRHLADRLSPGLARFYRQRRDLILAAVERPSVTEYGFTLWHDVDGIARSRSNSGEAAVVMEAVSHADLFVDVGANIGFFTCMAANRGCPVIAMEPHPLNLRCLYRNVADNNFANVEIFPIAVAERPGICDLFGGGQGASLLKGWAGIGATYVTKVPTNTLDNLLAGRPVERPVIKVDTEGNELAVLKGARRTLARSPKPVWFIEIGLTENFPEAVNPYFREIFEMMWANGYQAFTVPDSRKVLETDVRRWIANKRRDFGSVDFVFRDETTPVA